MIVTRAPLRLSIGGGGTDLPFYCSKFGGSMITAAINKYIYMVVQKREFYDEFLIRDKSFIGEEGPVKNVADITHTRIKAALEYLDITRPLEITSFADVPARTGLGSSGTYLIALLKALHAHKGEEISKIRLAEEAADIEMNILKEPIGKQDQYIASFGGLLNLEIEKNGKVIASPINICNSAFEELENNSLLFSTGIARSSVEVISEQKENAEADEEKMKQMHIIKEIGQEIKKALEAGEVSKFGKWLNVHWETKKKFGNKMTSDEINRYYEIGLRNGAIGGKIVGAGGGGFLLFYCEDNKEQLKEVMRKEGLRELPFGFDHEGCTVLYEGK